MSYIVSIMPTSAPDAVDGSSTEFDEKTLSFLRRHAA